MSERLKMRTFDDLVAEAAAADMTGWRFDWLNGRATEERPGWGYTALLSERLRQVRSSLDIDTGGGEILAKMPHLPARSAATESWEPNLVRAREQLVRRGVDVVRTTGTGELPFADESFELVTARHPVRIGWGEIERVLVPGGSYFAQHVGPRSAIELIEQLGAAVPEQQSERDPAAEVAAADDAGLIVVDLQRARCRMEFHDIGAIVWILRKCVWWVPDFTVTRYDSPLRRLDRQMRAGRPVVAYSTRHLIEARKPALGTKRTSDRLLAAREHPSALELGGDAGDVSRVQPEQGQQDDGIDQHQDHEDPQEDRLESDAIGQ